PTVRHSLRGLPNPLQARHWSLFTKRHAPTPRAISDYMPCRHADLVITDLKPLFGSYNALEVRKLSAFILKLRDMPKCWKHEKCRSLPKL
ncbi:hypothetical protein Tco_0406622, partial [Tanacetum coccineum]